MATKKTDPELRARALALVAGGASNRRAAAEVGVSESTVRNWRKEAETWPVGPDTWAGVAIVVPPGKLVEEDAPAEPAPEPPPADPDPDPEEAPPVDSADEGAAPSPPASGPAEPRPATQALAAVATRVRHVLAGALTAAAATVAVKEDKPPAPPESTLPGPPPWPCPDPGAAKGNTHAPETAGSTGQGEAPPPMPRGVPKDALAVRVYPDRVVYVTRQGRKVSIPKKGR